MPKKKNPAPVAKKQSSDQFTGVSGIAASGGEKKQP